MNVLKFLKLTYTFVLLLFKTIFSKRISIPKKLKMPKNSKLHHSLRRSLKSDKKRTSMTDKFIFPSIKLLEEPKVIDGLDAENTKNAEINKALLRTFQILK